jgi:hypothetical protein
MTPLGLLMRIAGRDPLRLRRRSSASSYWLPQPERGEAARYYRQF